MRRARQAVTALHLALACLQAILLLSGLELFPFVLVAWLFLAAPVLDFAVRVAGDWGLPMPDGPCLRTGQIGPAYWFTFPDAPRRRWTLDRRLAETVRGRAGRPSGPRTRHPDPLHHALAAGAQVTAFMFLGWMIDVVALALVDGPQGASFQERLAVVGLLTAAMALVPSIVATWTLYGMAFLVTHVAVAMLRRPTRDVRFHGQVLRVGARRAYVRTPGTTVRLDHDAFHAVLTVDDRHERLTIRGDHHHIRALYDEVRAVRPDRWCDERRAREALATARPAA